MVADDETPVERHRSARPQLQPWQLYAGRAGTEAFGKDLEGWPDLRAEAPTGATLQVVDGTASFIVNGLRDFRRVNSRVLP